MVKNIKGGKKSKGIARKHIAQPTEEKNIRLSSSDLEIYAVITRVLGHGMFYVATTEIPQLLGHIRNKFRGRSKRDNQVTLGTVVLVGLREWEYPNYKECDLLEVYDANEVRQLMKIPSIDFSDLYKYMDTLNNTLDDAVAVNEVEFTDEDYTADIMPSSSAKAENTDTEYLPELTNVVDPEDL